MHRGGNGESEGLRLLCETVECLFEGLDVFAEPVPVLLQARHTTLQVLLSDVFLSNMRRYITQNGHKKKRPKGLPMQCLHWMDG